MSFSGGVIGNVLLVAWRQPVLNNHLVFKKLHAVLPCLLVRVFQNGRICVKLSLGEVAINFVL